MKHPLRRTAAALAAGLALWAATSPSAHAHVTISADNPTRGGYTVLTLRVPSESSSARTVGLEVTFPSDTPITSVRTEPVPGWKATVSLEKLAAPTTTAGGTQVTERVAKVTWTATGPGLAPDEFVRFPLLAGPLPDADTLVLPAVQRYSDGTHIDWVEQAQGGAEAEHPAPDLTLTEGSADDAHGAHTSAAPTEAGISSQASVGPSSGTIWGVVGTVLGALGLLIGGWSVFRTGRR